MQRKAIVTGGAGFIGAHIANGLAALGYESVAIDIEHDTRGWLQPGVRLAQGDIRDAEFLKCEFAGARYVFHLAALPRVQYSIDFPREAHDVNINGTFAVLLAAREAGIKRVVYSASSSSYGNPAVLPLREDMLPDPMSPYANHKLFGEYSCSVFSKVYGLSAVSLRYFNVYGPNMDPDGAYALVIPKFFKMRLEGKPLTITGDGTQTRDFTHVRDVVRANILAAESPNVGKGEVINIGAGRNVSVNRIAELIGGSIEYIASRREPHDTLADISHAKKLLGWEPTISIEEGVAELKQLAGLP